MNIPFESALCCNSKRTFLGTLPFDCSQKFRWHFFRSVASDPTVELEIHQLLSVVFLRQQLDSFEKQAEDLAIS